ncbi:MAG: cell wall-binding repeat-containing protein [Lachnospiraceae bacterium]|nr:cell wall-binding repeat-containing protein [Lachnospiraceae bacterium]
MAQFRLNINGIGAATGTNFADALASVSLLGKNGSPLLLVPESRTATIESIVDELIRPNAALITKGYIFGGTGAVSEEIERFLQEASLE